jgi:acid phosphatase family membrane protein YuiD
MAFTGIIIYDALNVRFEAGLHASTINDFLWEKRFKESLWHLPSEAFVWSILGIIVAVILSFV